MKKEIQARILIVEDEPLAALEIQETLEKKGYIVSRVVTSGEQAVDSLIKTKPDLIIMDIHLKSFIDGIDAAHRIRLVSDTPIIYVTAYPNTAIKDRAAKTAPVAYLLKPFKEKELYSSVEKALKKK